MSNDVYQTPFNSRYAGRLSIFVLDSPWLKPESPGDEMKVLFSPRSRYSTWRQLWLWLAEAQKRTDPIPGSMHSIDRH